MKRTVADWARLADEAADERTLTQALDRAGELAQTCHDLRVVLRSASAREEVPPAKLAAIADRTLEAAARDRDVWGFRDAAAVRAGRLADRAGARAALELGEATLRAPRTDALGLAALSLGLPNAARAYEWILLGEGHRQILGDEPAQRRCLAQARADATEHGLGGELCDVASAYVVLGDAEVGRELLAQAEACTEPAEAWSLANAWRAAARPDEATRVLEMALRRAETVEDAVRVIRAYASHQLPGAARAALGRAQELARSTSDWLALGDCALDAGLGTDLVREAVERAEAVATTPEEKQDVAKAYAHWLGDADAAARVGPRGARPVASTAGSATALFDWLRARVGRERLAQIAAADYGADRDKHLAALEDIVATGELPRTLGWEPHEVLALTRWQEGEHTDHLARAFACVVLCLVPSGLDELATNGVILADSAIALGGDVTEHAEELAVFLSTPRQGPGEWDSGQETTVARLLALVLRAARAPEDDVIDARAGHLVEAAADLAELDAELAGGLRARVWAELIEAYLAPLSGRPNVRVVLDALPLTRAHA